MAMYASENRTLANTCTGRLLAQAPASKWSRRDSHTTGTDSRANTYQSPRAKLTACFQLTSRPALALEMWNWLAKDKPSSVQKQNPRSHWLQRLRRMPGKESGLSVVMPETLPDPSRLVKSEMTRPLALGARHLVPASGVKGFSKKYRLA